MSVNTYKTELLWSLWFVISGLIHMVIEGSFAVWPKYLENDNGFILADLWKEVRTKHPPRPSDYGCLPSPSASCAVDTVSVMMNELKRA